MKIEDYSVVLRIVQGTEDTEHFVTSWDSPILDTIPSDNDTIFVKKNNVLIVRYKENSFYSRGPFSESTTKHMSADWSLRYILKRLYPDLFVKEGE